MVKNLKNTLCVFESNVAVDSPLGQEKRSITEMAYRTTFETD